MSEIAAASDFFGGFEPTGGVKNLRYTASRTAPWPVWSGSAKKEPKTKPLTRGDARRIVNHLKRYLRHSLNVGRACERECRHLIEVMLFEFHNFKTGRLDPCYETIADRARMGRATVARYLRLLKEWGVINWQRRCSAEYEDGRYTLRQDSNSYAVLPPSQWKGYKAPQEPPRPERDELGLEPFIPDQSGQYAASEAIRAGAHGRAIIPALKSDPHDATALLLARMTERLAPEWEADRARKADSGQELVRTASNPNELKAALAQPRWFGRGVKS